MNIIQIGANRGSDELTELLEGIKVSSLVLVEPFEVHNEYMIKCYEKLGNYSIENIAIVPNEEQKELLFYYHINDEPLFDKASVDKNHILKHQYGGKDGKNYIGDESGLRTINVKCLTLNKLFEKYDFKDIHILYIDAEGIDDVLIKSIDFEKYNIDKIYFEHIHINFEDISQFLTSKGYKISFNISPYTSLAYKI
jgi:FkbM family methyltransferase